MTSHSSAVVIGSVEYLLRLLRGLCVVCKTEDSFVALLRDGDTKQLLRDMRDTGWRVSTPVTVAVGCVA